MGDDFLKDFAIPASTGLVASGLSNSLLASTHLAIKTSDPIAEVILRDGVRQTSLMTSVVAAIASYGFLHTRHKLSQQPVSNVIETHSEGKIVGSQQHQR